MAPLTWSRAGGTATPVALSEGGARERDARQQGAHGRPRAESAGRKKRAERSAASGRAGAGGGAGAGAGGPPSVPRVVRSG